MKKIRFLMIGGFLGAGKTTTIGKLAAHYVAQGKNVALVTNDQAYDLVDTHTLRAQGFDVGEVPGACFCCKFDDLVDTIASLSENSEDSENSGDSAKLPDIVIAEPVGSCTDLVATVAEPMRELFGDRFEVGPMVVLLKPEHGRKILADTPGKGFSPKAEYIFLKQLEEADAIVVNKADKLSHEQQQTLLNQIAQRFPDVPAICASAKTESNFEALINLTQQQRRERDSMMDIDYAVYAEGEAELGWLNCQIEAKSAEPFWLDELVVRVVSDMGRGLDDAGSEIAHLKVLGQTLTSAAVANRVASDSQTDLSLASEIQTPSADLLVNARVAASPDQLSGIVKLVAAQIAGELSISLSVKNIQSFRPGKPEPTHRKV